MDTGTLSKLFVEKRPDGIHLIIDEPGERCLRELLLPPDLILELYAQLSHGEA